MTDHDPFSNLPREADVPPALKQRTLAALRQRGLVRPAANPPTRALRAVLSLAAGLALFAAGDWNAQRRLSPASATTVTTESKYALMLYEPESFDSSLSHETLASEYGTWASTLGGRFVAGEALGDARTINAVGPVAELPRTERPTGYFIVRAATWDAAMAIARDCPHLRHGGIVSVRAIIT